MVLRLPNLTNLLTTEGKVWIAPTTVIIGGVEIGTQTCIGPNSVLRGDLNRITIGSMTSIQEDSFIETKETFGVVIGNRVSIGHNSILTGCRVGDGAIIGDQVSILEGAEIGEGAVIKSGTIIYQGQCIPPHVVVEGSPAHSVRSLTEEEIFRKQKYWQHVEQIWEALNNSETKDKLTA